MAAARLAESREALTQLDSHMQKRKEGEVTEVLVPLTGALYAKVATYYILLAYIRVSAKIMEKWEFIFGEGFLH